MLNGKPYRVTVLSLGAPDGVIPVDDIDGVDVPSPSSSPGTHALFPEGANIVFIQALDGDNLKAGFGGDVNGTGAPVKYFEEICRLTNN